MKLYLVVANASILCLCFGCQSKQTVLFSSGGKPGTDSKIKNPNAVSASAGSIIGLRDGGAVKAYGMNRYVDPADPGVMHERHAIYRLEQQPGWILGSPKYQNEVILGPVVGLKTAEYAPEPLPGETSREMMNARRSVEQANDSINVIRQNQEKLASSVESLAKETADAERKLTSVVSVLNERIRHLEGDSGNAPDERSQAATMGSSDAEVHVRPAN